MEYDLRCIVLRIAAEVQAYTPNLSTSVILGHYKAREPAGNGRH